MQPKIQALLVEPSEEVRLQLVQFMRSLLKQAPRLIQAFASDVASILVAATFDTHPNVLLVHTPLTLFRYALHCLLCNFQIRCKFARSPE